MNKVHKLQKAKRNQSPPKNLSLQKARAAHTIHGQEGLARGPHTLRTILFTEHLSTFLMETLSSFTFLVILPTQRNVDGCLKKKGMNQCCSV